MPHPRPYSAVATVSDGQCLLIADTEKAWPRGAGGRSDGRVYAESHVRSSVKVYRLIKGAVRVMAKGLYLSPLLLLIKAVTRLLPFDGPRYGDYLVVLFVCWVVLFFFMLSLMVLMHLFAKPRQRRSGRLMSRLPSENTFDEGCRMLGHSPQNGSREPIGNRLAGLATNDPGSREPVMVRGRLVRLDQGTQTAISDHWLEDEERAWRLFCSHPVAVVREGAPPLLLDFRTPPWIAAPYEKKRSVADDSALATLQQHLASMGPSSRTGDEPVPWQALIRSRHATELHAGDNVCILATAAEALDGEVASALAALKPDAQDAAAGSPYRQEQPGDDFALVCSATCPLIIQRV